MIIKMARAGVPKNENNIETAPLLLVARLNIAPVTI